jgi:arginine decarboxylase
VTEQVEQPRSDVHGLDSREQSRLQIAVVASIGQGQTPLSAFDAALWRCGVHGYNLLSLSSVVPPGSQIVACDHYQAPAAEHGHKLYVVKAEMRSEEPGAVIAAGLGWLQYGDGRGVFVEHELHESHGDCAAVERALTGQIMASLSDLAARRNVEFVAELAGSCITVTRVEREPKSAIAIAVYQSEAWR